jgi:hypothetical protein
MHNHPKKQNNPVRNMSEQDVLMACLQVYSEDEMAALSDRQFSDLVLMVVDGLTAPPYTLSVQSLLQIKLLVESNC